MELNEKILKAIQEDLPSATAGELKKFIEEANATKVKLGQLESSSEFYLKELEGYKKKENEFAQATELNQESEAKLKEAQKLSDKYRFDIQAEQIKQRDFVINKFEGFLNNLVKNPRAIEMISEVKNVPVYVPYPGGGGSHESRSEITTGERTKEETKD